MIRAIVVGIPIIFAALLLAAFLNALSLSITRKPKNEWTIALGGDPQNFNPLQLTDTPSAKISENIFQGLLKLDENLELAPQLAKSWKLSQTTTFFFPNTEATKQALASLQACSIQWPKWNVVSATASGCRLLLRLSVPGSDTSHQIAKVLAPSPLLVNVFRVEFAKDSAHTAYASDQASLPSLLGEKTWYDYDSAYEAILLGSPQKGLDIFTHLHPKTEKPASSVRLLSSTPFLAEPEIDFQLHQNIKWQDGVSFTARDVAFTFQCLMDESVHSPHKSYFDNVLRLETPNNFHVRVIYRKPYSPGLESWTLGLIPAHILEGKSQDWWEKNFNRQPMGLGPFQFAEWKTNEIVRLIRNPLYFESPPWLEAITYRIIPDPLTQRLAFESHQVDSWGVPPWAVKTVQANRRYQLYSTTENSYTFLGWNLRNPLFQDLRVRQALAAALNVPELVQYILYGQGIQSTGIFPPNQWYFFQGVKPIKYDPASAAALLDSAGWKLGKDGIRLKAGQRLAFTLITPSNNNISQDVATLAQDAFLKIGVEVKIESYEWAVFISQHVLKLDFQAVALGLTRGNYNVYSLWSSTQTHPGQFNFVGYSSPQVDTLLERIRDEYDRTKIIHIAAELQQRIYQDQPFLFLFTPKNTTALWRNAFRICRPDGKGGFLETPIEQTPAGWNYYSQWFYRPEYEGKLPPHTLAKQL